MKAYLLIVFLLVTPFISKAHEFFFSFAEVEYNAITERFEMTLTVTTHDLETALKEKGAEINNIASLSTADIQNIENYVNKSVVFTMNSHESTFSLSGHEHFLNGTSNLYFESLPIAFTSEITLKYNLLMEVFPEQQNKMTLYFEDKSRTAAFTPMKKTQTIYFEN